MTMIATAPGSGAPAAAPMSMMTAAVQLKNEGDTVFTMKYGPLDRLTLQPGQSVFVMEEVAWHFLGRWWANNDNPRDRQRVEEVRRLRTLYGAYEDDMMWEGIGIDPLTNEQRVPRKPKLSAYGADGTRITSVVDDPDGLEGKTAQTSFGKEQDLELKLAMLQQTVLQLQAQIGAQPEAIIPEIPEEAAVTPAPAPTVPVATMPTSQMVGGQVSVPVAPPAMTPSSPGMLGSEIPVHAQTEYDPVAAFNAMTPEEQQTVLQARRAAGLPIDGLAGAETVVDDVPVDAPQKVPTGGRIPAGS